MSKKLSKRLEYISTFLPTDYDVYYDLCCDHGQLGFHIAHKEIFNVVNLIDRVPSIVNDLKKSPLASDIPDSVIINYICLDACHLKIDKSYKNVISIAGIGGELTIKMVENLLDQLDSNDLLVISAHNNLHKLRRYLLSSDLEVTKEGLVEENKKFYEVIALKRSNNSNTTKIIEFSGEKSEVRKYETYYNQQVSYLEKKLLHALDKDNEELLKLYKSSKSKLK